jgi:hypothetical protein
MTSNPTIFNVSIFRIELSIAIISILFTNNKIETGIFSSI